MCFIGAPSRSSPSLHAGRARARHTPSALQREDDLKLLSDAKLQQLSTLVTFCVTLRMLDYLQGVYEEYRCLFEMFYSTVCGGVACSVSEWNLYVLREAKRKYNI